MPDWHAIRDRLREHGVRVVHDTHGRSVGGGDISQAWRIDTSEGPIFLKTGVASAFDMFAAEAEGLIEIASANAIRVPAVIACGITAKDSFLAIEWLDLEQPTAAVERQLGERLAQLHRHQKNRFGWHRNNTIGRTPQENAWSGDWISFFCKRRLQYQLDLARENGYTGEIQHLGEHLVEHLARLFDGYDPAASLLHGDLWGGNWASSGAQPVLFDPAVYYGDRESDIAMTRLFGGFGKEFYAAYEASWPLESGHEQRCRLYQLYHVLNHLNLFGRSYLGRALDLMRGLPDRQAQGQSGKSLTSPDSSTS